MFETYFGFRENPFKLDLDLSYLFWGQHQKEVIAHLRYAVIEGEGFIAITGDRGVGKTILCHSFIENLNKNTIAAYINNPVGSSEELLRNINRQFEIRQDAQIFIETTDALNSFLMQTKLKGKKVVVFIDDAHLLKKDTLEQVRLISNLETSRDKLIQIVLVGEPKLTEMLASYDLRQIGQRVSVKYHIAPFSFSETIDYIQHRVSIAFKGPFELFDQKAFRHIFKVSGGNPRAINIACYRALMKAFNRNETRVTDDIAKESVGYLSGRHQKVWFEYYKRKGIVRITAGCGFLMAIIATGYFFQPGPFESSERQPTAQKHQSAMVSELKSAQSPVKLAATDIEPKPSIGESLANRERAATMAAPPEPLNESFPVTPMPPQKLTHSVQVGAFLKEDDAKKLVGQLKAKGHSAQIVPVMDAKDRSWYTVRVGDYPSKRAARVGADEFSAIEKMKTAVRPFDKF